MLNSIWKALRDEARTGEAPRPTPAGPPVRWSWIALAVSALPIGVLLTAMIFVTAAFRVGLDADMNGMLAEMPFWTMLRGVPELGGFGLIFVVLGRFLANRSGRPKRRFLVLVPAIPTGIALLLTLGRIFYAPSLMTLGFIAAAFLLAAYAYLAVAQALASGKRTVA